MLEESFSSSVVFDHGNSKGDSVQNCQGNDLFGTVFTGNILDIIEICWLELKNVLMRLTVAVPFLYGQVGHKPATLAPVVTGCGDDDGSMMKNGGYNLFGQFTTYYFNQQTEDIGMMVAMTQQLRLIGGPYGWQIRKSNQHV
jgi:hypothetical protein